MSSKVGIVVHEQFVTTVDNKILLLDIMITLELKCYFLNTKDICDTDIYIP